VRPHPRARFQPNLSNANPKTQTPQIELSFFNNSHTVDLARHFLSRGALHDATFLQARRARGSRGWGLGVMERS
jgi:hypothetical protein